jgi:hypothetical protein
VWSLATNASGGNIPANKGSYSGGPTGNVTDTVKVTDSLGNVATANVTVTPPPSGGGCSQGGTIGCPGWIGLALAALLRRRPLRRQSGDLKDPPRK